MKSRQLAIFLSVPLGLLLMGSALAATLTVGYQIKPQRHTNLLKTVMAVNGTGCQKSFTASPANHEDSVEGCTVTPGDNYTVKLTRQSYQGGGDIPHGPAAVCNIQFSMKSSGQLASMTATPGATNPPYDQNLCDSFGVVLVPTKISGGSSNIQLVSCANDKSYKGSNPPPCYQPPQNTN